MKQKQTLTNKICTPLKAFRMCQHVRRLNKHIVFTNGCFDILHKGHVFYLEAAKKKGDFLIVALDTDSAVKKLKGFHRPINSLKDRMYVLAALESVDAVTWFGGNNPLPLIKKLKPHILVKGGDWAIPTIIGSKEVKNWGGKVFSLPYIKGWSTTDIVKKIKEFA